MRKLATIALIDDVQPIPEADKIERVRVSGWGCVSKKGDFTVGIRQCFLSLNPFSP